jgi:hypothetical protein
MKMIATVFAVAASALVLAPAALAADAFTITVPVEFKSLHPDIKSVRVICHVRGPDPATGKLRDWGSDPYGKSVNLALTNGNYTGPAQVTVVFRTEDFTPQEQANLGAINQATCNFGLSAADGKLYAPTGAQNTPLLGAKPGTTIHQNVSAPIK